MWEQENSGFNHEYQNTTTIMHTKLEDKISPCHINKTTLQFRTDVKQEDLYETIHPL